MATKSTSTKLQQKTAADAQSIAVPQQRGAQARKPSYLKYTMKKQDGDDELGESLKSKAKGKAGWRWWWWRWQRRRRYAGLHTKSTFGYAKLQPALIYYSTNSDASIRIESRSHERPREVYLEMRGSRHGYAYKLGMKNNYHMHIGYGPIGTASHTSDAMRIDPAGNINFLGAVEIQGKPLRAFSTDFARGSGLSCKGGIKVHNSAGHTSGWSTCEAGYTAVGIQSIVLDLKHGHPHHAEIDDYTCDSRGCRARCVGRDCTVQARCCMTQDGPLKCYGAHQRNQYPNRWGHPSWCHWRYAATGFTRLHLLNQQPNQWQAVDDFYVGNRYARSWCYQRRWHAHTPWWIRRWWWYYKRFHHFRRYILRRYYKGNKPACLAQARCCRPRYHNQRLHCIHGSRAHGSANNWGPWSKCPSYYTAVSLMRIDMLDHVHRAYKNMAKYECKSDTSSDFEGCRAYGWNAQHVTYAKCCRVLPWRL